MRALCFYKKSSKLLKLAPMWRARQDLNLWPTGS